jgi:hypothetical protein
MIETIKIAHPEIEGEYMVINAADFNPALHVRFVEGEPGGDDTGKKGKGKGKKPPTVNAALLAKIKPNGEGESEGEGEGEQGDLGLDETTTD